MAKRLYIVPEFTLVNDDGSHRHVKYFRAPDGTLLIYPYAAMDYGFQPIFLVQADLTPAQDTALVANADVYGFPFNLDTAISGGAINQTRNVHESFLIPLQSVPATYRLLARYDAGLFHFMQRLNYVYGNTAVIDSTAKLNVQWQSIPADIQAALLDTANSLGYTLAPAPTDQIRAILKSMADQWGNKSFDLGGFIF